MRRLSTCISIVGLVCFALRFSCNAQSLAFDWARNAGSTGIDFANSVATDGAGDIYLTGRFEGTADFNPGAGVFNLTSTVPGTDDIFVLKLNSNGNFLWAVNMGGPSDDQGYAIDVDAAGNVYTTGYFQGTADFAPLVEATEFLTSVGSFDIFISKLNTDGEFEWAKQIGNAGSDLPGDIDVDASGNVYLTGQYSGTTDFNPDPSPPSVFNLTSVAGTGDIFVLKLDTDGAFVWAKSLGGSNNDDFGLGISADGLGNVFTAGYFSSSADFNPGAPNFPLTSIGNRDIFISKLDNTGNFIWAKSVGSSNNDQAQGITTDASGDVLITGYFSGTADFDTGSGTDNISNSSSSDDEIFILKITSAGNYDWAASMGGELGDQGLSIATDASGNVYTTGYFEGTSNFNTAGSFELTAAASRDVYISKFDPTGSFIWAGAVGGSGIDIGRGIAVDPSDNIITCGAFAQTADFDPGPSTYNVTYTGNAGNWDSYILKLKPSALPAEPLEPNYIWAKAMGGTYNDEGSAVVVDGAGNVYTVGIFYFTVDFDPGAGVFNLSPASSSNGWQDIFITKFDADGNFIWAKQLGGPLYESPRGMVLDNSGNLLITGYFSGTADFDPGAGTANLSSPVGSDIFICKLDNSGNFIWAKRIGGGSNDNGYAITTDATGNVYTTGYFIGTVDFDPNAGTSNLTSAGITDIFISKLDAGGNFVWAKRIGGTTVEQSTAIAVDATSVYITGSFAGTVDFDPGAGVTTFTSAGSYDMFVTKLDDSGNFVWARQMDGGTDCYPQALALDPSGNIITTGYFSGVSDFDPGAGAYTLTSAGIDDIFVSKLSSSGNFVWAKRIGANSYDQAKSISIDALGNSYITGYFINTVDFDPGPSTFDLTASGGSDIFVAKLDASGNLAWADRMGGTNTDMGNGVARDPSGNLYYVGAFGSVADFGTGSCTLNLTSAGQTDIFVLKLSETPPPSPIIFSPLTPLNGPPGTSVTIDGINFDPVPSNNIVMFSDLVATVSSSTSSSIVAVVPVGALTGDISVTVGCSTGISDDTFTVTGPCNIPLNEREALEDLYNNTNGPGWANSTNWLTANESTWFGVSVSGCRVRELDLSSNGLDGNLPASISNLPYLEVLRLDNNYTLTGPLPANIDNMVSLREIHLQQNGLTGTFPTSLEDCPALEVIDLEGNQISDDIPTFLGSMTNLKSINFGSNNLTGSIPPELGNLSNITFLSLAGNNLYGPIPSDLGNLISLELLDLSDNELYGAIPAEIGNLFLLQYLRLSSNYLNGSFPDVIENLINLEELELYNNSLAGPINADFTGLTSLRTILFSNNQLTGDLPASISSLTMLSNVDVTQNLFTSIPVISSYDLHVENNLLDFGDLEPNMSSAVNFSYSPQGKLPPGGNISFTVGGTLTIPFTTGGTDNSYQWYTDGNPIPGATSSTLSIPGMTLADVGLYYVQITSATLVPGLTLESQPFLAITDPCTTTTPTSGDLDVSFDPLIEDPTSVSAIGIQSTGKIIASITYTTINGGPADGVVRFDTDGTLDNTFTPNSYYAGPNHIIIQPDDKILTTYYWGYMNDFLELIRLEADGADDASFNTFSTESLYGYALQPDGKILVSFSEEGVPPTLMRLEADGSDDPSFFPLEDYPASVIRVQSNGNILLGGDFSGGIVMLDPTGAIEPGFIANADGEVTDIALQADGKIIVVGSFSYFNDVPYRGIVRLNSDGSLDDTFNTIGMSDLLSTANYPTRVSILGNGKIVVAGDFNSWNGVARENLVGLNADGTIDCQFDPGTSTDETIYSLALQADGKILIGGSFSEYDGTVRHGLARVNNSSVNISIVTQPQNTSECLNYSETISTIATGTTNIQYRWQFATSSTGPFTDINNGGGYSFVTSSTVIINTTGNFGEGFYRCRINGDLAAEVFTNVVFFDVIVVAPPTASDVTVCAGDPIVLTATGGTDGNYRWVDSDNSDVTGAVNGTFIDDGNNFGPPFQVYLVEGSCESTRVTVNVNINPCTDPPVIEATQITVAVKSSATLDLLPLLSDPNDDLDLNTLTIAQQPNSGAVASLNGTELTIDYEGISFSGTDNLRIRVCDLSGGCTEQDLSIEVVGDITVYNAVSPGEDGKNDTFYLQYIEILESTKSNHVTIFNRWGDVVWEVDNYDNDTRVFRGLNKNGNELPSGIYFYKIIFSGGAKPVEGFISLKR